MSVVLWKEYLLDETGLAKRNVLSSSFSIDGYLYITVSIFVVGHMWTK